MYKSTSGCELNHGLNNKYNFVDISVLKKKRENRYVNMTDFTFGLEVEEILLNSSEEYLLLFPSYTQDVKYVAPTTVQELLTLADISCKPFVKQMYTGLEEESANEIVAHLCAKKILDYSYGKIIQSEKNLNVYKFQRQKFEINEEGKRHRIYPTVLTKTFHRVECLKAHG